jgi:DNA-binding response OmpR family regulator
MEKGEKRILVVDDDDAIRTLLLTILRRRGLPVDTARNGAEALERLGRCRYSVMLLDLMMPRLNGWQVLEQIGKYDASRRPVVIVLTAGTEPRDIDPNLVAGSIKKPFDVELLLDMVTACLSAASNHDQLPGCPGPESDERRPPRPG